MSRVQTSHLLPTYARVDLAFERGEGAWLIATNGERYLDFTSGVAVNALGHAHPHLVAAITEQARKVWHVSNLYRIPESRAAGRPPVRGELRGRGVLRQFRRRGDGMRDQDGAQIPGGERQAGALPHHHLRGRLPRAHAGDAGGRRSEEVSRRLRPGGRRLRPGAVRRPGSDQARDRARDRRDPDRADHGRGRRARGAARVPAGAAPALRRATGCCWCSTRCRPASGAPASCSPISAAASPPTSWRSPRRWAAASRSAPASPPPRPPRA